MNNAINEFQVILPIILIGISLVFLVFRKRNLFGFFFMGAILVTLFLIIDTVDTRKQNKKIAGVYKYSWGDPLAIEEWNGVRIPDSCRIILLESLEFKIENCPAFITDSTGYWASHTNTNHSWVRFKNKDKVDVGIRQQFPFKEIQVVIDGSRNLVFTKSDQALR